MFSESEFEEYWTLWSTDEEANYKLIKNAKGHSIKKYLKKGYTHFDLKFWFPERKDELKKILQKGLKVYNQNHKRDEWWAFSPFLKVLIKTPRYKYQDEETGYDLETKVRPICFASHIDGLIFSFYAFALTKKYEKFIADKGFEKCVLAYRSNYDSKCNIQFAKEVFEEVKKRGNCVAIALDIKGYFDHINHKKLKEKWVKIWGEKLPDDQFKIYKALTEYTYVSKSSILKKYSVNLRKLGHAPKTLLEFIPGKKDFEKFQRLRTDRLMVTNSKPKKGHLIGIPQGSAMSAMLSNFYLVDFDHELYAKSKDEDFLYRRYCDDILVVCSPEKALELQKFIIEKISGDYFLEIQNKKVELTEFRPNSKGIIRAFNKKKQIEEGLATIDDKSERYYYKSLQYLGFEFNGQDIFIRSSSLSRYYRKMKSRIVKTVSMAYSKNGKADKVWKEQLFHRYTHLGKRNFLKYAYNASKQTYKNAKGETKEGMNSPAIRRQLARHFDVLIYTLTNKNMQRFKWKSKKQKVTLKSV